MNGREESDKRYREKAIKKLVGLPQFVTTWYLTLVASENTAATINEYITVVRNFIQSQNIKSLNDITTTTTTNFIISSQTKENGKPASQNTKIIIYRVMNIFEEYLYINNMISTNYVKNIRKPKAESHDVREAKKVYLNEDDFKAMRKAAEYDPRDYAMLTLFMNTGIRLTALDNINLSDYDSENHTLNIIDKGNKTITKHLNHNTCEALDDYINYYRYELYPYHDTDAMFVTRHGRISPSAIQRMVNKYANKALNRHLYPHKLRGGYVTIAYNHSGDINLVREAVGHSDIKTTERYLSSDHKAEQKVSDIFEDIL